MSTASSAQQHYFVLANNYERRALLENLVKKNRPNATVKVFAHPSAMKEFLEIIIESNIDFKKIILMKGEKFLEEINEAKKYFEINCESYKSITNPSSKVFVIKGVSKI